MKFSRLLLLIFLSLTVIFGGGGFMPAVAFADITQLSNNADTKNLQFDKVYLYLGNGISGTLTEASFVINDVNTPYTNYIALTLASYSTEAEALDIGVSSPVDTLSLTAYYTGTGVQTATITGLSKIFDPDLFYVIYEGGNYNSAATLYWRGFSSDIGLGRCVDSPLGGSGGCGSVIDLTYDLVGVTDLPPANCSDGIQNQDETGIDTGGICQDYSNLYSNTLSTGFLCSGAQSGNFKGYQYLGQGLSSNLSRVDIKLLTPGPVYYGKRVSMHIYQSDVYLDNFSDIIASNLVWQKGSTFGNSFNINSFDGVVAFTSPDFGSDYNFIPTKHYYLVPKFYTSDAGSICQFSYLYGSSDSNSFSSGEFYSDAYVKDIYFRLYGIPKPVLPPACTTDCFSNVLFLPGLMGSRLYKQGNSLDKELWVSSIDSAQADLALNAQGKSINNLYTKDDTQNNGEEEKGIIDEIFGANIYNSLIDDLRNWKQDGTISDYAFIPYDWRLSLEDIITNGSVLANDNLSYGTAQDFSESFILKKLEALQSNSKSGKVTIIAHSNGGLVAKALVQKLKDTGNPLYDKIDKIILITVPQVGTPDAVAALLHGSELGLAGLIMERDRLRQLSENMPTVYNLLPSASYFTTVDPAFAVDKLVSFENKPFFDPQTSQYGVYVSNEAELKNYVLGTDGRIKPSFNDTVHPNIGNSLLYTQAESVHQMLDAWQPSPDTKVIQVAGWGEETLAGLDYKTYLNSAGAEYLSYKLRMIVDGDGTVVVPSALWMSTAPNVERWWMDLKKEEGIIINRVHKDILEIPNLRNFIKSKIIDIGFVDLENIIVNNTSTLTSDDSRLHYTLHSPLTLGIIDAQGRYTGQDPITRQIREEIPNVDYKQIGDVQFISAPADMAYTVKMEGYQEGSFSIDVDKQEGNNITASTSFQGIPLGTSTVAMMEVAPDFEVSNSILSIDQNGDGTIDKTLNATPGGVTVYDVIPPELQVTFDMSSRDVIFSAQDVIDQNPMIATTKNSATLTDNAGNTTIIPFTKYKEKPTRLRFSYNKIIRNGVITNVPNTNVVYDWQEKKGVLTDLDTKITVKGVEKYTFNYKRKNNATIIKEKTSAGTITTTKSGFVVVMVRTEGNSVKVNY